MFPSLRRRLPLCCAALLLSVAPASARDPITVMLPATPDGTVKTFATAMSEGKMEVIWQALPSGYQADIQKVLVTFAKNMDSDVWTKGNGLLGKVSKLLTDKADFIVAHPLIAQNLEKNKADAADVKAMIKEVGGLLSDIQTETATLDNVEKLKIDVLLAKMGARFKAMEATAVKVMPESSKNNLSSMKNVTVKVVSTAGDRATVEITQPDGEVKTKEMVQVEGKWLPKEFTEEFRTGMDKAQTAVEGMRIPPEVKQQVIASSGMADALLDGLVNAKTQADFDSAVNGLLPLIQGMIPGGAPR